MALSLRVSKYRIGLDREHWRYKVVDFWGHGAINCISPQEVAERLYEQFGAKIASARYVPVDKDPSNGLKRGVYLKCFSEFPQQVGRVNDNELAEIADCAMKFVKTKGAR